MIVVTGAGGFIGGHLVRALAGGGEAVRALVRRPPEAPLPAGVEAVVGDVGDPASLAAALAGARLVYHAAGSYRGGAAELWRVHAEGTANVLGAADPGTRVVLVSSTSVYGWRRPWPADEGTPTRPASAYGAAKVAAENLVLGWQRGDGVVARTTIVYGPGDRHGMVPRAARLLRSGWRWFPGTGANRIHLTHVDDLVAGLVALGREGEGVYLFAGPRAAPVAEILGGVAAAVGARPPVFAVPARLAAAGAAALEAAWRGGEAPLGTHSVEVLTEDRAYAPRRAPSELGWQPRIDLGDDLAAAVEQPAEGAGGGDRAGHRPRRAPAGPARAAPARGVGPAMEPAACPGSPWERFIADHDEGIGSVYERFVLNRVIDDAIEATGARSILHGPAFGMAGVPGLDAIFQARRGIPVGLLDVSPGRLEAVVGLWGELGCRPDATWLAPWPDTSGWAEVVPAGRYDLVLSFAALWWCARPWEVLAAQARWAGRGVLLCIPNRNVFMQVRSRFWHQDMFEHLNPDALDVDTVVREARAVGLELSGTGLFDIPPFPDTAISIKELIPAFGRRTGAGAGGGEAAWRWEIVPYLKGEDPGLEDRIARIGFLEDRVGDRVARRWAHHRYYLFEPASATQRR